MDEEVSHKFPRVEIKKIKREIDHYDILDVDAILESNIEKVRLSLEQDIFDDISSESDEKIILVPVKDYRIDSPRGVNEVQDVMDTRFIMEHVPSV
jgi:hypothetical protein